MTRYVVAWLVANGAYTTMLFTALIIKVGRRLKSRYGIYARYFVDDHYAKFTTYMCKNDLLMARWYSGNPVIHWVLLIIIGWLIAIRMLGRYYDFEEAEDNFELYEGD